MSRQEYRAVQWEGHAPPMEHRPWWNVRHPTAEKSPHGYDKDTPFLWMISSNHVAPGFYHPSTQEYSPWCLLLRFMLMDLPHQLEHDASLRSWADHLVPQNKPALLRPGHISPREKQQQRWGRRFLFSPPATSESPDRLGKWLVVAYLWGESKEWLETVDIGNLVASADTIGGKIHEKLPNSYSGNNTVKRRQDWYKIHEMRGISAGNSITSVDIPGGTQMSDRTRRGRVGTEPEIFSEELRAYIAAHNSILIGGGRQKPHSTAQKLFEREAEVRAESACQSKIPPEREVEGYVEAVGPNQIRSERDFYTEVPRGWFMVRITPRY